jgi:WD40 repeat protein
VAFSPDGGRLATADRGLKVWDTASRKIVFDNGPSLADLIFSKDKEKMSEHFWGLVFSPDGKHVASAGSSGVEIWDAVTGKKIRSMRGPRRFSNTVAYSADGKQLAGVGRVVTLWDAATGEVVRTFPEFPDAVLKVSFTRDRRRLLAASAGSARVWEIPSGQEVYRVGLTGTLAPTRRHPIGIGKASFSADGHRLATAPGDGTVKVWDMTTGQQILSLSGPGSQTVCVVFSPDGRWLAAGGLDGTPLFPSRERHQQRTMCSFVQMILAERGWFVATKGILRLWDARPVEENKR